MKSAGFTMIELIFVIVILGILAAVAVPKLAATRDDAKATTALAAWKGALNDIQAQSAATGTVPVFTNIVDGSSSLVVTGTSIAARNAANDDDCVVATNVSGVLQIRKDTVGIATAGCELLTNVADANITLTGSTVTR